MYSGISPHSREISIFGLLEAFQITLKLEISQKILTMFGNRKFSGVSDDNSHDLGRKMRTTKPSRNSQEYKSVLNNSSHGLFSIEDEEDEDEGETLLIF